MKVNVYSEVGKKKEAMNLPGNLVADLNLPILAQAIRVFENRKHPGIAKVKGRGEVIASTHKIYRQKGTGGARHGAKSAPIFVGGGIAHGPTGEKRTLSMPAKMRARALQVALNLKAKEEKLLVVDGLSKLAKTRDAQTLISAVRKDSGNGKETSITVALAEENSGSLRYLRNLSGVVVTQYRHLNAYSVFFGGLILIDVEALEAGKEEKKKGNKKKQTAATKEKTAKKL